VGEGVSGSAGAWEADSPTPVEPVETRVGRDLR